MRNTGSSQIVFRKCIIQYSKVGATLVTS